MSVFGRAMEVVYSTTNVWSGMPYVLAAAGVFAGGIIVLSFFFGGIEYIFYGKERRSIQLVTVDKERTTQAWVDIPTGTGRNLAHLFLISAFFLGIVFVIWISTSVIGLNPWSSAAATLTLGVVLTYSFAGLLGHFSAGIATLGTSSIAVGQYWEFANYPEYNGFIHSIEKLAVYMTRFDESTQSGELLYVPMSFFINNLRKTNASKQKQLMPGFRIYQKKPDVFGVRKRVTSLNKAEKNV